MQVLAAWLRHVAKLLSWHCSWQVVFAVAVHEPPQAAVHFVLQSAVVETATHCVLQWSLQQALHEAWQSVDDSDEDDPPSVDDEDIDEHEAVQLDEQVDSQLVVQSNVGGLEAQLVAQLLWQLDVQLLSAIALHWLSHVCSSWAAHAVSQLAGAHCVVQSFWTAIVHIALASMSMFPQAERTSARATLGSASSAANAAATDA
jgi:hypothetical protein